MLVRYCTAVALKRHERVNAFNLVLVLFSVAEIRADCINDLHLRSSSESDPSPCNCCLQ